MLHRVIFAFLLPLLFVAGCGSKNSKEIAEVNEMLKASYEAMAQFVAALDKAADRDGIIIAIREYEDNLDRLLPKAIAMKDVMRRINGADPPAEIEAAVEETKQLTGRFLQAYAKVMEYSKDPEVHAALAGMMKKNNAMPAIRVW